MLLQRYYSNRLCKRQQALLQLNPQKGRTTMSTQTNLAEMQAKDLRMLVFSSWQERARCKQLFEEDEELKNFIYLDDSRSPVVPEKAVPLLRKKGLKFQALKPITTDTSKSLTKDDFTPKQRKLIQQRKAYSVKIRGLALFLIELKHSLPDHLFH